MLKNKIEDLKIKSLNKNKEMIYQINKINIKKNNWSSTIWTPYSDYTQLIGYILKIKGTTKRIRILLLIVVLME